MSIKIYKDLKTEHRYKKGGNKVMIRFHQNCLHEAGTWLRRKTIRGQLEYSNGMGKYALERPTKR